MNFRQHFLADLPIEPAEAIIVLGERSQEWLDSPGEPSDQANKIFITEILLQFIKRYELDIDISKIDPANPDIADYVAAITKFSAAHEVGKLLDNYEIASGRDALGIAKLTADEKSKLHKHIDRIRKIVEKSPLSTRKKTKLFARLNELAAEVDMEGTPTDRFFALAGDAAFVTGEMAEKAKPFLKEVKEILKIISRSRAKTEGIDLPKGQEPLQLPSGEED